MTNPDAFKTELEALSATLDRLVDTVRRLSEENRSLRHSQEQLAFVCVGFLVRFVLVCCCVEAMIQRLKALENTG